ncbi:MAG: nucleotidyltransferase family protein [Chloroflexi bacterium]|nr:nucleotidyltransferase family protein [Chloroflexota bacterium]
MDRESVVRTLKEHKPTLSKRFGVTELALFGSFARDQNTESSDVDILVTFNKPATSKAFFGVQFYIEDLLGCRVDLVTEKALRPEFRPQIEREAMYV